MQKEISSLRLKLTEMEAIVNDRTLSDGTSILPPPCLLHFRFTLLLVFKGSRKSIGRISTAGVLTEENSNGSDIPNAAVFIDSLERCKAVSSFSLSNFSRF